MNTLQQPFPIPLYPDGGKPAGRRRATSGRPGVTRAFLDGGVRTQEPNRVDGDVDLGTTGAGKMRGQHLFNHVAPADHLAPDIHEVSVGSPQGRHRLGIPRVEGLHENLGGLADGLLVLGVGRVGGMWPEADFFVRARTAPTSHINEHANGDSAQRDQRGHETAAVPLPGLIHDGCLLVQI